MHRPEQVNQDHIDALVQAVFSLESEEECRSFLRDLCTMQELIQLSQRLQVAKLLFNGETYDAIRAQLPVSSTTITRISTALHFGAGGYRAVLGRQGEKADAPEPV
ncbi:MAG: hypothetical protein HFF67_06945 [Oscillospiraceae bacterium]|nr:hypothetical protein [Oscillospiraceae bacterium]